MRPKRIYDCSIEKLKSFHCWNFTNDPHQFCGSHSCVPENVLCLAFAHTNNLNGFLAQCTTSFVHFFFSRLSLSSSLSICTQSLLQKNEKISKSRWNKSQHFTIAGWVCSHTNSTHRKCDRKSFPSEKKIHKILVILAHSLIGIDRRIQYEVFRKKMPFSHFDAPNACDL